MISSQPFSTINYSHYVITIWFPVVRYCNIKSSVRLPRPIEIELDILINKSQRKAISCSRPIARENAKGWLSLAEDVPGDFSAYHEARKLKTKTIAKTMTRNSAEIVLPEMIVTKKGNAPFFFFYRSQEKIQLQYTLTSKDFMAYALILEQIGFELFRITKVTSVTNYCTW